MGESFPHEITQVNPALLAATARFLAPSSDDFAPADLPEEAGGLLRDGVLRRLEGSRAGKVLVRAYLLRQSGLADPAPFTDFRDERRRLALLDRETTARLALLFGACLYAPEAARCIRREEVRALRASLGDSYEYILSRGRFQVRQARDLFTSFRRDLALHARMNAAGCAALRLCMADWPLPLRQRAAPRLPAELRGPCDADPRCDRENLAVLWQAVKKLLLKEVAPQWQPCFA
ncbi:MAG: SctK family type III secretion system sorting platform protein [Desulfovibrio sp.]|nr:SctK family type III secretion system sorting platform protein [Desulfovibrio sp.]